MRILLSDKKLCLSLFGIVALLMLSIFRFDIADKGKWISFHPHEIPIDAVSFSPPSTISKDPNTGQLRVHRLGTDQLGRDVASRLVHGTYIALIVGLYSSFISLVIALILGGLSGYLGNQSHKISWISIFALLIGVGISHYYAFEEAFSYDSDSRWFWSLGLYLIHIVIGLVLVLTIVWLIERITPIPRTYIHWDSIVIKLIEVFKSMPRLFLLLAVLAIISTPSVYAVIIIIGCLRWPGLTRVIRAEILKTKQESYVNNAKLLGLTDLSIYLKHVLPNIYKPILILTMLNIGTAILIESSLSFLHLGLPSTEVSWGRMLSDARDYIPAWWLALGPGVLIFISILSFNTISQRLSHHFESN